MSEYTQVPHVNELNSFIQSEIERYPAYVKIIKPKAKHLKGRPTQNSSQFSSTITHQEATRKKNFNPLVSTNVGNHP